MFIENTLFHIMLSISQEFIHLVLKTPFCGRYYHAPFSDADLSQRGPGAPMSFVSQNETTVAQ